MTPEDIEIQDLRREVNKLSKKLNIALKDIRKSCDTCRHEITCSVECEGKFDSEKRFFLCNGGLSQWSWRGEESSNK